jgi:hypothetical protein
VVKKYFTWILLFVAVAVCVYISIDLRNERERADRVSKLNQLLTGKLNKATDRIGDLEKFQDLDRRTIKNLERDKQRFAAANSELVRINDEQGKIIDRLTAGIRIDSGILGRLREIIEGLPKRN